MKKYAGWLAIAFVLFFMITEPTGASSVIHSALHGLGRAFTGLSSFVTSLTA